jgi:hypothetical protein
MPHPAWFTEHGSQGVVQRAYPKEFAQTAVYDPQKGFWRIGTIAA